MIKVGVISPYVEFSQSIRQIAEELAIPLVVKEGGLQRGVAAANKLIAEENVNVLIARGPTANLLEKKLAIPVIKIDVTNFDLFKALVQAKQFSREIIFVDHAENQNKYDLAFLEEQLSITIRCAEYLDEKGIVQQIKSVTSADCVIVGTAECISKTASSRGLTSVVIHSSREAIHEALLRAQQTTIFYEKEKLRQKHLETIISYAFDGVIATDNAGLISVFNEQAAEMMGLSMEDVLGKDISKIVHPFMKKLLGEGNTATKKIISHGSSSYVVNRIILDSGQQGVTSVVITFQEANKVIQRDSNLRSELYNRRFYAKYQFSDIIYTSEQMKKVVEMAKMYSQSDSAVLILGESGTGKELFAQSMHQASKRREGPFIAINCAALPESLLESELFGYEEGAFTGAKKGGKPGLFEMAHQGTLFLDEIGELPLNLQARLLRVLQEQEVMRVGGERLIPVNVRIISATNKDLRQYAQEGKFRLDLYYRLNILQIYIPALRERKEDILPIANYFLKMKQENASLCTEWQKALKNHDWPGNIRELENTVERFAVLNAFSEGQSVEELLLAEIMGEVGSTKKIELELGTLEEMEQQIITKLERVYAGNKTELAEQLGVSRTTLWKKMKAR